MRRRSDASSRACSRSSARRRERYLRETRGIDTGAIDDMLAEPYAIGWHPSVFFREQGHPLDGKRLGCIVGVMTDPVTALPTGAICRTYVHEGRKIGTAKTLGSPAGIIRLSPDDERHSRPASRRGHRERARRAWRFGLRPIWATGSTALMAKFPVLPGIEALTIVADNDRNGDGEKAAREAERRWLQAGREVWVVMRDETRRHQRRDQGWRK